MINRLAGKKVYIAGKVTGQEEIAKKRFGDAEKAINNFSPTSSVMNPTILPLGFKHNDYLRICIEMLKSCDVMIVLPNWQPSVGVQMELDVALAEDIDIYFLGDLLSEKDLLFSNDDCDTTDIYRAMHRLCR